MKLKLDPVLLAKFPGASITFVVARLPDAFLPEHHEYIAKIRGQLRDQIEAPPLSLTKAKYRVDSLNVKRWREVYTQTGVKPKSYPPSVDALTGRVLKDGIWNPISPTVDAYNCASVAHQYPMGAYDLATITGDITVRMTAGGETFFPLGQVQKSGELVSRFDTEDGQVVYADDEKVLCWSWNYRDCGVTPIAEDTRYGIYFIDCPGDSPYSSPEEALSTLIAHFKAIGCEVLGTGVVNTDVNECEIPLVVQASDQVAFDEKKRRSQAAFERMQSDQAPDAPAAVIEADRGARLFDRRDVNPDAVRRVQRERNNQHAFVRMGSGLPSDSHQYLVGNDCAMLFANLDVVIESTIKSLLRDRSSSTITPYHYAASSGNPEILRRLERFLPAAQAGVDSKSLFDHKDPSDLASSFTVEKKSLDPHGDPLFMALAHGDMQACNRILMIFAADALLRHFDACKEQDGYGCDAWHYAVLNNMTILIDLLRDIGLPCDNISSMGQTPCCVATHNKATLAALLACRHDNPLTGAKAIKVDINQPDTEHGWTPLMYAQAMGFSEAVHLLLQEPDIDKDAVDAEGRTYEEVTLSSQTNRLVF